MNDEVLREELAAIPVIAGLGVRFGQLRGGTAVATLPPAGHTLSHVGSVSAGPLFALGEAAAAACVWGLFGDSVRDVVPLARSAEITFLRIAQGPLTATAQVSNPAELRAELRGRGKARFAANVEIRDWDEALVCELTVQFHVRSGASLSH